jgi:hypothetical protein
MSSTWPSVGMNCGASPSPPIASSVIEASASSASRATSCRICGSLRCASGSFASMRSGKVCRRSTNSCQPGTDDGRAADAGAGALAARAAKGNAASASAARLNGQNRRIDMGTLLSVSVRRSVTRFAMGGNGLRLAPSLCYSSV